MSYIFRLSTVILLSLFCVLMSGEKNDGAIDNLLTDVSCGDTQKMMDECFKDLPPNLMEFLQTTKIAINRDEIAAKCTVFKRGMRCFDNYTERCLSKEKIYYIQNNVAGAKKFLSKFCDDRKFQAEYIRHKECFTHIQEDWNRCTKDFQNIISEELHGNTQHQNISNKFMQFCCARHAYENCIYNSARFKCYKNSAKFAKGTAKMLSDEKLFTHCKKYENLLCAAPKTTMRQNLFFLLISSLIAIAWRTDNT